MTGLDQRSYFFDDGICFGCRRCGACCTGHPGVVRVSRRDLADIAPYLHMPVSQVVEDYLYRWENGYSIKEARDGRCLFFDDGCRIYPVRPNQCRTFPFWFANLRAEYRWDLIRNQCPGIGNGRHYTKAEILDILGSSLQQRQRFEKRP